MSSSVAKNNPSTMGSFVMSRSVILVAFVIVLLLLCLLSVALGTREVTWEEIISALQGNLNTVGEAAVAMRIPRTVLAVIAGASLGLSGTVMQGITRNPLADPGILGVNIGAAFFVVVGLAWLGMNQIQTYVWMAILGAALTAAFVYTIGSMGRGGATPLKLALAGAATSAALSCFTIAVVLPRNDIAGGARSWQIGGVGGATFETMSLVWPFLLVGLVITAFTARKLNSLALGDELAAGLGENVVLARSAAGLGAVLLCGATTAICGPIGFVGLVVPHCCRLFVGVDHRWLLPFSAVGGASLLLLADIMGRIISRPSELSVGVVTAFIGAPFFIWIVRRQRVREL
ncbi:iron ABC transporter permease [Vibrio gazogenes]|uniref:Iron complex transport system permease protein n=1 Tax=Vibrio gazogenes DSM 21264 = NBRC 103151 TaxID=1123492 RepID=A0A1M4Z8D3_VIBGA|nr:iron ABC transporter permease [Vibrio gazogenes]USP12489.1 iron ABC transporter permease [Vibrio gazogenes]SHF14280.1 iron complex transport system permease protein [Vibrio gazogenes DSM 21264] [Vibrio gazogenes DSM 21264 = NBRC 103151]SJN53926.1 putative siderophore transport system permease protein YfiZ precursor [Vibrio gazogenes]